MSIGAGSKRSFASTVRYAPGYPARCAKALDEALASTEAYESWRALDPGPHLPVFSRYAALPALTKAFVRAHGPQAFVPNGRSIEGGLASHEIELVKTSGATGDQVTNVWYQPWWDASEAASWRLNERASAASRTGDREAILTSPWCAGFPCEDDFLAMRERTLGRFLYLSERSDPSTWSEALMDRMAAELAAYRPARLEANPSFLAKLSRHIVKRGLRVPSPEIIILTYENPSIAHRRDIGRAFDAPIASSYGATEAGYVFMECEAGRMHQVARSCHVDFLPFTPEHGGPDIGCILVTTFDNPWRSLIRFDISDVVRLDRSAGCPCGRREGLTLRSVEGRTQSLTMTPDGRAVTQGAVDRALGGIGGLIEYQLLQEGASVYHLRFAAEEEAPSVAEEASRALRGVYGPDAAVSVERVDAVAPDPPGKYLLAKSLEPVDAGALLDEAFSPVRP
jgi:phenylacetate-CoA ligase